MKILFILFSAVLLGAQENQLSLWESTSSRDANCCRSIRPFPGQIKIKHLEYQGIGFNKGYSTLELFLSPPKAWNYSNYLFLDFRAHVFNDGRPAFNGGFGWRYLFDPLRGAIGANAYYDYRKTKHLKINQFGLGLEYLSPHWEARVNGYFPFGSKASRLFDLKFSHFAANQFFVSRKYEFAMTGGDAEIGCHFFRRKFFDLYAGTGPYYFKGRLGKPAIGGKARIAARIPPYFSLEAGDSYDQIFHNRFHLEAAISIPFGPKARPHIEKAGCRSCSQQIALQRWLYDPPNRNEIIVLDTKEKTRAAIDPESGLPFFFLFVDNTSSSDGTFENPYSTLLAAELNSEPGNVIYVFPGDRTDRGMNSGISLQTNQRFLGAGISHSFLTTLGAIDVPPQAVGLPVIGNSDAGGIFAVVLLANNNEVSGFFINETRGLNGIGAHTSFGNNTVIAQNIIQTLNSGVCVFLQGNPFMGNVNITNCAFLGADTSDTFGIDLFQAEVGNIYIADNVFSGVNETSGLAKGIDLFHTQNLNVRILNNVFSSVSSNGVIPHAIGVDPFTTQDTFFLDLEIIGNQINLPNTLVGLIGGVVIKNEAGEGPFTIFLENNTVVSPSGVPGYLIDNAGSSSEVLLQFGSKNSGVLEINGPVTLSE